MGGIRRYGWLLLVTLCLGNYAFGQQNIHGTLLSEENEPIPFAKIRVAGTNRGAIANEDGSFTLEDVKPTDTLIISHYAISTQPIIASFFFTENILVLDRRFLQLEEIEVSSTKGALLNLFDEARDALSSAPGYFSKTYFSLESDADAHPVELIEAYYQGKTQGGRIQDMTLKNGRIGMSPLDNEYFASLSTTQIIKDYNLHSPLRSRFPRNPLMLSVRKIKKWYNYKVSSVYDGVLTITFTPKNAINRYALFPTKVYLHKPSKQIIRLELMKEDLKTYPFTEINPGDTIQRLDYFAAYNFDEQRLESVELNYKMKYDGFSGLKNIHSRAVLLFYDTTSSFSLPIYSDRVSLYSDYDKIVSQPNNPFFWSLNAAISPSDKKTAYKEYFETHGVLLNFDELSKVSPTVFAQKLVPWSKNRIQLYDMNEAIAYEIAVADAKEFHNKTLVSDMYDLRAFVYVDRNAGEDSTHFKVQTLINLQDSYYYLFRSPFTVCFVNLYFDLVEIERRNLERKLVGLKPSESQMRDLYQESQINLNRRLKQYLKSVEHGRNQQVLNYYIELVKSELGIDNSFLIQEEIVLSDSLIQPPTDPIIQRYNYGSALLKIGEYQRALEVLSEAEAMGDQHPWLLYNLGICHLELGNIEVACFYFLKSEAQGEKLESKIQGICTKYWLKPTK